ncbi:MAG: sterol desaturase family protein [Acidimicrobiales bacterium]
MDLTVAAVPFYFGSMEAERRWLAAHATERGPTAADYTREDTIASLSMGVGSLLAPFVAQRIVRSLAPGRGRYGKVLVRTAVVAALATSLADRIAASEPGVDSDGVGTAADGLVRPSRDQRRWARKVASVGGVTAIAAGVLACSTAAADRTDAKAMWKKGERHDLGSGLLAWAAAVAGWDFIYYWNHRFMHESRALWAIHVVHHSSEHYNLSTALRQPVADVLGAFIPYGLLARVGIRPALVAQARGINLIYQYWIHTDVIRSIGAPGEAVLNTPSHHRVHHGANSKYIDRNHGSILILWDRLFGTYQPEEEQVVYGLTKNINTYDPVRIATHEYSDIIRDVAHSTNWRDRLSFVLRGPGWAYERHRAAAAAAGPTVSAVPAA